MTSEVALMNRLAVALAADSASTVTYFEDGKRKRRYFKGANKIFNLSQTEPVGIMINGSGSLQRMPWEVIVKQYRESRSGKTFDKLQDYAVDFFKYLAAKDLFSAAYQHRQLITGVSEVVGNIILAILDEDDVKAATSPADRIKLIQAHLAEKEAWAAPLGYISDTAKKLASEAEKKHLDEITTEFESGKLHAVAKNLIDLDRVYKLAVHAFFKPDVTSMSNTGIVIAGYGKSELFPSLEQYECYGVILGTVLHSRNDDDCKAITFDAPSEIVPIAQDVMAWTFMFGASVDAIIQFQNHFEQELIACTEALKKSGELDAKVDLPALQKSVIEKVRIKNRDYVHKDATKLRRVIGMMPVGELADLAETLVSLESLKERTTKDSESVSGPIDVAVITKGDGFIWVKRKHYFDAALNLRFVAKKHSEAGQ